MCVCFCLPLFILNAHIVYMCGVTPPRMDSRYVDGDIFLSTTRVHNFSAAESSTVFYGGARIRNLRIARIDFRVQCQRIVRVCVAVCLCLCAADANYKR